MTTSVSIMVKCPCCGSERRYLGDPSSPAEWNVQITAMVCSVCGKLLGGGRITVEQRDQAATTHIHRLKD